MEKDRRDTAEYVMEHEGARRERERKGDIERSLETFERIP